MHHIPFLLHNFTFHSTLDRAFDLSITLNSFCNGTKESCYCKSNDSYAFAKLMTKVCVPLPFLGNKMHKLTNKSNDSAFLLSENFNEGFFNSVQHFHRTLNFISHYWCISVHRLFLWHEPSSHFCLSITAVYVDVLQLGKRKLLL